MRWSAIMAWAGLGCAAAAGAVLDTGNPLPAVWKERHVQFHYAGRTARYSCEGLQEKIRALLLELGARRDLRVESDGCELNSPSLQLVFSSPALPDAAARPLHRGDLKPLDARFERFTLTSDAFRNFGIADCELVEEFARQILPKLAARAVQQDIHCVPYQASGSRYWVRGEILRNLPRDEQRLGNVNSTTP